MRTEKNSKTVRFSLEEIKKMRGQTNWARLYFEEMSERNLQQRVQVQQTKRGN